MDLGSIFTSSASGSCKRRAIDTAPRKLTSSSGNSAAAKADAEYTDAPASLTTILFTFRSGIFDAINLITSMASLSVSRLAVPLPMEISSTLCCTIMRASVANEPCQSLRGWCG